MSPKKTSQDEETPMLDLVATYGAQGAPEDQDADTSPDAGPSDETEVEGDQEQPEDDIPDILAGVSDAAPASFLADDEDEEPGSDIEVALEEDEQSDAGEEASAEHVAQDEDEILEDEVDLPVPAPEVAPAISVEMPPDAGHALPDRIVLRQNVLEIAAGLQGETLGRKAAARKLREACEADAAELDIDDIEVDFDAAPADRAGLSFLAALGAPKPKPKATDPVEAALLAAIKQRDRVSALRIVGDSPDGHDRAAYQDALRVLRDALNAHLTD